MTTTTAAVVESGGGPFTLHEAGVGELEEIRALTRGGTDISIEATGSAALRRQAVDALAPLGTCGIVGAPAHGTEVSLDLTHLLTAGRVVRGIVAGDSIPDLFLPQLHRFWKEGRFPVERMWRSTTSTRSTGPPTTRSPAARSRPCCACPEHVMRRERSTP